MELQTISYTQGKGWSVEFFPDLDSEQTLILIFAAPEFLQNSEPLQRFCKHYKNSKIIGCSTSGEIFGPYISDHSISIAIAKFDKTTIKIIKTEIKSAADSFNAGERLIEQLPMEQLRGVFVLSDGLSVNGSELVRGLNTQGNNLIITGGLAGDGSNFKQTWTLFNGEIKSNQIVAVGFYGDSIEIGHASRGGWDIFGPQRRITHAAGNVLYELDNQPALALYKEYLGERASGLPATGLLFPLAIRKNSSDDVQLVRTILAVDEKNQSLIFAGDVPTGYFAQLMRANFDRLITSASEAGTLAIERMLKKDDMAKTDHPILAIAISCVGRRLLLGERTEEETESMLENLPNNTLQIGFYSYGEISPYTTGKCELHNQTMTLTTFYEV